jgi:hypothetical protein
MNPLRFSLATLVGVVILLGIGLAALRSASDVWAAGVFTGTLLFLFVSVLGVTFTRGRRRVFWGGFAIFGWGYSILALGPQFADLIGPHLLTSKMLMALQEVIPQFRIRAGDKVLVKWGNSWYRSTVLSVQNGMYQIHYDGYSSASDEVVPSNRIKVGEPVHFLRIGHSMFGLVFGLLGSALALRMSQESIRADDAR